MKYIKYSWEELEVLEMFGYKPQIALFYREQPE